MKGLPVRNVVFPLSGMISLRAVMEDGTSVEFASVGREGVVGIGALLGTGWGTGNAVGQIPGRAIRVPSELVLTEIERDRRFRAAIDRYVHTLIVMVAQNVACSRVHNIEQRAAKWLLLTGDRVESTELRLTQQALAEMLGVHRPSVSQAVHSLASRGVVDVRRGRCIVSDRARLESLACECYGTIRQEFERVAGSKGSFQPRE